QCVRDVQQHYRTLPGKVFIYGHSQGGQFAISSALLHPDQVAGVFDQAGTLPIDFIATPDNIARLKEHDIRVHLLHGQQDTTFPPENSKQLNDLLQKSGVAVTLQFVPGSHTLNPEMVRQIRAWLDTEVRAK